MPTTIAEIKGFLDEFDLKYQVDEERDAILIGFDCSNENGTYRDGDGDAYMQVVIRVLEGGDFLAVFVPNAWNIAESVSKPLILEACVSFQMRYKMLRFDYDPDDGEIRPNIELPLEDSALTSRQFHRLIHGVLHGVQRFDRVVRHVIETGEVSCECLDDAGQASPASDEAARLNDLAESAGGIDELEKLLGGGEPEADAA
jgi:hypothetical protein